MSGAPDLASRPTDLAQLTVCPKCGEPLSSSSKEWTCPKSHTFPVVGKVPWLFPFPEAKLAEWRWHLQVQLDRLDGKVAQMKQEQGLPDLLPATKKRLAKLIQGYQEHKKALSQLLTPLGKVGEQPLPGSEAWGSKIPLTQIVTSYFENLHRDWGGIEAGEAENRLARDRLVPLVKEHCGANPTVITLGAGGCRLPYDIHQAIPDCFSIVADINPLLFFAAKRIVEGRGVSLYEFPQHALELEKVCKINKLKAPEAVADNFHFVFADCLAPPFAAGGFDVVMTPWFLDIVPEDIRTLTKRVNRLLKPGGLWLNFGPLGVASPYVSRQYTKEELEEIAGETGFTVQTSTLETIPYLRTPLAHSYRMEDVLFFAATKQQETSDPGSYHYLPEWLTDHSLPVPLNQPVQQFQLQHEAYSRIGKLIDGRASINDLAAQLVAQFRMTEDQAKETLVNLLGTLTESHTFNRSS